jgi:hypothetical protein
MRGETEYQCPRCKARKKAAKAPECCGEKMKPAPLPVCTTAASAEHSRPMDDEEPCDDSRGG